MIIMRTVGVADLLKGFNSITADQAPFAVAKALTMTVRDARAKVTEHIKRDFDNPTTFTQNAMAFSPANKQELKSSVFVKEIQGAYLFEQIKGGVRGFKKFEEKFGFNEVALPGWGAKRNQFGNMSKAEIMRIAANLKDANKGKTYFRSESKHNPNVTVVYQRSKETAKLIPDLIFVDKATYQKRFMFQEVAEKTINNNLSKNMQLAWHEAMKSRR
ncbi:hypothetical protein [Undibacterium sp. Ji22W]|uniref:hypothetical protein n=1 Tax=Undibacterium sp. Ji22W TaxID=3413038 RepID=UPI003BF22936